MRRRRRGCCFGHGHEAEAGGRHRQQPAGSWSSHLMGSGGSQQPALRSEELDVPFAVARQGYGRAAAIAAVSRA